MDFFEKIGDTISDKGRKAADKAKELAEIANYKGQIFNHEEAMKKKYMEIGRIYFEHYGNMPEAPFEDACRSINEAKESVKELQAKIQELKGM